MPSFFIHTFGCQSNKSDSERIAGDYFARGYTEAKDWHECDELVINTCAVRQRAEDKAEGFLYNVTEHFKQSAQPQPKIILTGCMVHHGNQKLLERLPEVDEILPINEVGFNQAAIRKDKKHAWIPISTGCNSFCTYCIVPYSRGREKSRSKEEIMQEVKNLADQGYEEITLLGMNVNSWGLEKVGIGFRKMMMENKDFNREDLPDNQSQYLTPQGTPPFVKLLQDISQFDQIKMIRFMSSNPWDFHDELIEEIGRNKKIDRYVHLPIQSGSNEVLYRMNRGYTRERYIEVVDKLKKADPEIVIGTDIVVGFAGETEAEFQETVDLAKQMDWHVGFVAIYSPRPGTAGWKIYPDNIPHHVKKKRWEILDQIINKDNLQIRPKVV
ncbi:MAG: MiaB/RimO family radical SAM methylthiotransferase [Candidatus Pacebacteria bacterium]|nr:MiaB/RimO family radical SAM methylthiotransferase [Candidatus Paceibacterota bacterium]MBT4005226.1 MiaB/RimO family radical SAM methylthiotransferase [Candidatus Paceibacterota bacterium]MBT4358946.1 MiaB/RimO family radical SAM methylthiotransferase [Candidatus Paceibacterota bacterium]MBT4680489.1 MiaB/RimO family radical SAM methylthiotransferase [Candidatus Paceibacterota bacterium]MBT6898582.1 MiaB/RimO family radical SAM methylthiotransferase [Candidatus Paceibacterota bacterium]